MKKILLICLISFSFLNVGWFSTYKIDVRDVSNFYTTVKLKDAPEVMLSNLDDERANRRLIGRIGSLKFVPEMSVNVFFTDRVAARLKTFGFNIKKQNISSNPKKISRTLYKKNAKSFITGDIFKFSFTEIDPETRNVTARSVFNIRVYDKNGINVFDKFFCVSVAKNISDKPLTNTEYLVEELLNASMDTLFSDKQFASLMNIDETQYKKLKDNAYYDKNLTMELDSLVSKYKALKISKKEFLKKRDILIDSF